MLWGGWGERKRERAGHDGKGEGEKRPLPHNVRFTGRICSSVVLAKGPTIWTLPIVPRALSIFFYYCYFYRDIQREPRRRREWPGCFKSCFDLGFQFLNVEKDGKCDCQSDKTLIEKKNARFVHLSE